MSWWLKERPWWVAAIVALIVGILCYWSDWAILFNLYEVESGDLIRNSGKAIVAAGILGIVFSHHRIVISFGLLFPAFVIRQFTIAHDSPPNSNLRDFVLLVDVALVILITVVVFLAAAGRKWYLKKHQYKP